MAQGFIPGAHRHWDGDPFRDEHSGFARGAVRAGPLGMHDEPSRLDALCDRIVNSTHWFATHEYAVRVFGMHSFGLGIVYGIGENLVTSVIEVFELAKTFILADLYDARKGTTPLAMRIARDGILWPTREAASHVAQWFFEPTLRRAHQERDDLIQTLWEIIAHPVDALSAIKDGYVRQWNEFRTYQKQDSLISQFQAGRIFGSLLLDLISLIAGSAGFARALIAAFPKLVKSVERLQRTANALVRDKHLKGTNGTAPHTVESATPTALLTTNTDLPSITPPPKLLPPPATRPRIEYGVTLPNKWAPKADAKRKSGKGKDGAGEKANESAKPVTGVRLKTVPLQPEYVGENIEGRRSWILPGEGPVKYLDDTQKAKHHLTIKNGKLYEANGRLFDTRKAKTWDGIIRAIFVMDERGNVFASKRQVRFRFHHSSLSQGRPVSMAGEMEVNNGVLEYISNQSGHYKPPERMLKHAIDHLKEQGIDFSFVMVEVAQ